MKHENIRSCILLCGGMSRRMGQDKGTMLINEKPMIIHILEKLNYQIDEVIIVLNDEKRIAKYKSLIQNHIKNKLKTDFDYEMIFLEDEIKNQGPLSGIMTGLKTIKGKYGLVLPCDSPFITSNFIKNMFNILNENLEEEIFIEGIVPYHNKNMDLLEKLTKEKELPEDIGFKNSLINNSEPLHSIYKSSIYPDIEELLHSNKNDVKSLIKNINSYFIPIYDNISNEDNKKNNYSTHGINNIENNFKNINSKEDLDN
ncbi:molybdenum cofactor guanylyltransferase [Methanobrevibacter cuticularis]|uniref:Probable molybdenum cofactor guanylyltransferase n=1 Tax=Methanobrevibacter cuticularis TaxID=47311 RepID=A0A166CHW3_9EURY|nr:molybdenum cofactor guanylyltransferase [Methanobrevibacter cuticularis]KZX14507.1 molybdenum cofactor guanylyltransferase [Methanobrevibacter cuticularis]